MLQQVCPVPECSFPLMRTKDKKLMCVACDMEVVVQKEGEEKKAAAPASAPAAVSPTVTEASVEAAAEEEDWSPPTAEEEVGTLQDAVGASILKAHCMPLVLVVTACICGEEEEA